MHTGQLYLGHLSGPVEGILTIVAVYIVTGIAGVYTPMFTGDMIELRLRLGTGFWDQDFLTFTRLEKIPIVLEYIPRLRLNDASMVFGGVVLALNIVTR